MSDPTIKRGRRILRFFLSEERFEEIAPDMDDLLFARRESGESHPERRYFIDILSIVSRSSLRRPRDTWAQRGLETTRSPIMLKNHLIVALRRLRKQKGFAFINAAGLGLGLACCLFIYLFVQHEVSYDRQVPSPESTFRLTVDLTNAQGSHWAPIGPAVGPAVQAGFPEVAEMTRFFPSEGSIVATRDGNSLQIINGGFADSTFIDFMGLELAEGDPLTALTRPGQLVLSRSAATQLFGTGSPLGQNLLIDGQWTVEVSGILADPAYPTHLPVNYLIPMATFYSGNEEWLESSWTWSAFHTYVRLHNPMGRTSFEAKMPAFLDETVGELGGQPASSLVTVVPQPIRDIHLHSQLEKEYQANGNVSYVVIFSMVALLILLIACVNFVNLATAKAASRMSEVGIRKTFGAARSQLIRQYLSESILLAVAGLGIAAVVIGSFLPVFNGLTGLDWTFVSMVTSPAGLALLGMSLVAGAIAGFYPAIVLSGFKPIDAMRSKSGLERRRGILRKGLVVFQFAISIFLISASLIIWRQVQFLKTTDLGFDQERVISVSLSDELIGVVTENPSTIKSSLLANSSILAVSNASDLPGERYSIESMTVDGLVEESVSMRIAWRTDHDYVSALGLTVVEGRDFSEFAPADTAGWLLNEAAVAQLGLQEPIGQTMRWGTTYSGPILGVVKDFNFASLHSDIEPLVIPLRPGFGGKLLVRFQGRNEAEVLDHIRASVDALSPGSVFTIAFLDDSFQMLYAEEFRLQEVLGYFTLMAILIAGLGLFGLSAFMAEQRTREIGLRKVLGATTGSILNLMSRDFLILIGIAFVVSVPLGWMAADAWLGNFAFRVSLEPLSFAAAGVMATLIALLSVGYQAIGASLANPIDAIRHE